MVTWMQIPFFKKKIFFFRCTVHQSWSPRQAAMLTCFLGLGYQQLAQNWDPMASMWATVCAVGLVWATDWQLVLDWVPYINSKFKKD
ncbi:cytochrome b-c1 complex subunit 10-like [Erinaceus europaeus]|uniref:Cytochrome b-c1 complex subunit 10-like n=1 Tax=Erinaceus europaeus TaxID=9365 RepID=A0ABM3X0S8_ERIEU|nr:cytochrome b-c1 complex subunit 10-like [Erinaceus europaeus]